jgi:hypothetical protein
MKASYAIEPQLVHRYDYSALILTVLVMNDTGAVAVWEGLKTSTVRILE